MADKDLDCWESDAQLADIYHVTRQTIWRWVTNDPTFPRPVKLSAGCTRFSRKKRLEWEQSRAEAS